MPRRLSGRQAQIMRVLYRLGQGTVAEVQASMADPPSDSALRTMLARMESRGLVERRRDHSGHIYRPSRPLDEAASDATAQLLDTYFGGSVASLVSGLLSRDDRQLGDDDLAALESLVRKARERRDTGPRDSGEG